MSVLSYSLLTAMMCGLFSATTAFAPVPRTSLVPYRIVRHQSRGRSLYASASQRQLTNKTKIATAGEFFLTLHYQNRPIIDGYVEMDAQISIDDTGTVDPPVYSQKISLLGITPRVTTLSVFGNFGGVDVVGTASIKNAAGLLQIVSSRLELSSGSPVLTIPVTANPENTQ